MQLHLKIDELELVKRLTEDRDRLSCDTQAPIAQLSGQLHLQDELKIGRDLVGKGLSRNLELASTDSKISLTSSPGARIN